MNSTLLSANDMLANSPTQLMLVTLPFRPVAFEISDKGIVCQNGGHTHYATICYDIDSKQFLVLEFNSVFLSSVAGYSQRNTFNYDNKNECVFILSYSNTGKLKIALAAPREFDKPTDRQMLSVFSMYSKLDKWYLKHQGRKVSGFYE